MSSKYYCDHCHKEIAGAPGEASVFIQVARFADHAKARGATISDLCNDCFAELRAYVKAFMGWK